MPNILQCMLRNYGLPSILQHDTVDPSNLITVITECKLFYNPAHKNIQKLAWQARLMHNKLYGHIPTLEIGEITQLEPCRQSITFLTYLRHF